MAAGRGGRRRPVAVLVVPRRCVARSRPVLSARSRPMRCRSASGLDAVVAGAGQRARRTRRRPLVVVIDDYHLIDNDDVHRRRRAAHRARARRHLTHRHRDARRPAVPARPAPRPGQLTEIRAADLRFDPDEAAGLLAHAATGLRPGPSISCCERTEGWAAGLVLAGLSLRTATTSTASSTASTATTNSSSTTSPTSSSLDRRRRPPAAARRRRSSIASPARSIDAVSRLDRRQPSGCAATRRRQPAGHRPRPHRHLVPLPPPAARPAASGAPTDVARALATSTRGRRRGTAKQATYAGDRALPLGGDASRPATSSPTTPRSCSTAGRSSPSPATSTGSATWPNATMGCAHRARLDARS